MSRLDDAMDEHMAFIVLMEKRPFSFKDFLCFKVGENEHKIAHKTFRNKILSRKKKQMVELDFNCGTAYYTLKGHRFGKSVTRDHTGVRSFKTIANVNVNSNVYKMLESLPLDKQSMHNIRIRFTAPGLWHALLALFYTSNSNAYWNSDSGCCGGGCSSNCSNSNCPNPNPNYLNLIHMNQRSKDIVIPTFSRAGCLVQVKVHKTNTVSVIISCSVRPIALDINGIIHFFTLLAITEERLRSFLSLSFAAVSAGTGAANQIGIQIPVYQTWIITMWHFGQDSLIEYCGEPFSVTVEDAQHVLTRIYAKGFPNNASSPCYGNKHKTKRRIRLERQEYPNTNVLDAIEDKLEN